MRRVDCPLGWMAGWARFMCTLTQSSRPDPIRASGIRRARAGNAPATWLHSSFLNRPRALETAPQGFLKPSVGSVEARGRSTHRFHATGSAGGREASSDSESGPTGLVGRTADEVAGAAWRRVFRRPLGRRIELVD